MKFTVDKEVFTKAMHQLSGVILQKSTINILFNALLEAYNDKLKITNLFNKVKVREVLPKDVSSLDPSMKSFFNLNTPEDLEKARKL